MIDGIPNRPLDFYQKDISGYNGITWYNPQLWQYDWGMIKWSGVIILFSSFSSHWDTIAGVPGPIQPLKLAFADVMCT